MSARRRRRRPPSALKPFWFVGCAVLVVAIVAGYFIVSWPGFRPKYVRVVGNAIVPTSEILERAQIERNRNIWLQSADAIASRVDAIPYVLSVHVRRVPPGGMVIAVRERHPFAVVRSGGESVLVDPGLRVLQLAPAQNGSLPVFVVSPPIAFVPGHFLTQQRVLTMRAALLSLRAHAVNVTELDNDRGDVRAVLGGGVHVLLGDEANVAAAVPLVEPILTRFALLGRFVATIDLRSPSTPVVTERRGTKLQRSGRRSRRGHDAVILEDQDGTA